MKIRLTTVFIICFFPLIIYSQNFKEKKIIIDKYNFLIDSFSLVPNSCIVSDTNGNIITNEKILINDITSIATIKDSMLIGETLYFKYEFFPVLLTKTYYNRKIKFIEPENKNYYWERNNNNVQNNNTASNLFKEGSISRNIMFGNNQNVSVLSNIDLRINGNLSEDLKIQAVLSDNNLPFQEDGESYKLQELDKIYIRIYNKNNEITIGDIINKSKNRFLIYNKKSKGLLVRTNRTKNNWDLSSEYSMSLSKGIYCSNRFNGIEGNQGPYKLVGNNNENYIVILSGSEKIYIDGQKLTRGYENDYIIDYNTSEVTFTSNCLITREKRIYIEFEYNNQSYPESVITSIQNISNENINFNFNIYSEMDWKNQNYSQNLSEEQKKQISLIQDNHTDISIESIDSVEFNSELVLYKKTDTLINNETIIIYKYSSNADSAHYKVQFSYVGNNIGNYILKENGVNGKVYEWIAPILDQGNWVPQGNYDPIIFIKAPKSKNIFSAEIDYDLSKNILINLNTTFENINQNLFSDNDQNINNSIASSIGINYNIYDSKRLNIFGRNSIEYIQESFEGVNRYRNVEFNRRWGIDNANGNQIIINNAFNVHFDSIKVLKYQINRILIGKNYQAYSHDITSENKWKSNALKIIYENTYVQKDLEKSKINLFNATIEKKLIKYNLSFNSQMEQREYKEDDIILENSSQFYQFSTKFSDKIKKMSLKLLFRSDNKPNSNMLIKFSESKECQLNWNILNINNVRNNTILNIRRINFSPDSINDEFNIIIQNILSSNIFKNFLNINMDYKIGKGKESLREQQFIKVSEGIGTHNWVDENQNGIQEINEFLISVFQEEANYVSLLLPSNELRDIYFLNYLQKITIKFKEIFNNDILNKINFSSTLNLNSKNRELSYNPFNENIDFISNDLQQNHIYSLLYRNNTNYFYANMSFIKSNVKKNYSYGTENKMINEYKFEQSFKIFKKYTNQSIFSFGSQEKSSSFFKNQELKFDFLKIEDKITMYLNKRMKVDLNLLYNQKNTSKYNSLYSTEFGLSFNSENNIGIINSSLKYINIDFEISENGLINYELMEGLQVGNNFIGDIIISKKFKNNMILKLNYILRKSEENKTVHSAKMGITAYF